MPSLSARPKDAKEVAGERVRVAKQYDADRKQLETQRDEMKKKLGEAKERKTKLTKEALEEYERTLVSINESTTLAERPATEKLKQAEEKLEIKKQRFEAEITALDAYVAKEVAAKLAMEKQVDGETKESFYAITPSMLSTEKIVDHLMSGGGCQTEEVVAANSNHMINLLNTVLNEAKKHK